MLGVSTNRTRDSVLRDIESNQYHQYEAAPSGKNAHGAPQPLHYIDTTTEGGDTTTTHRIKYRGSSRNDLNDRHRKNKREKRKRQQMQ